MSNRARWTGRCGLGEFGDDVRGVACDVADPASVERAAQATFRGLRQGPCRLQQCRRRRRWRHRPDLGRQLALGGRCQPDGRGVRHPLLPAAYPRPWRRRAYRQHRLDGRHDQRHGVQPLCAATKFAVVAMSEGLAMQLQPHGIGVSVLCPEFVRTGSARAAATVPSATGRRRRSTPTVRPPLSSPRSHGEIATGLDPAEVAARVLAAIREDQLYIFTHPNMREARGWPLRRDPGRDGPGDDRLKRRGIGSIHGYSRLRNGAKARRRAIALWLFWFCA